MTTIFKFDTEYSADSVEFCPISGFEKLVVVGTYQVLESELTDESPSRVGSILSFQADQNDNVRFMKTIPTNAILDLKWAHDLVGEKPVLAAADAKSYITLYDASNDFDVVGKYFSGKENVLNLSLDWANRIQKSNFKLVFSQSDGYINLIQVSDSGHFELLNSWKGHELEAWISSFDCWNPEIIYSGADDGLMKKWDVRQGLSTATDVIKSHDAGVCTIQSSPLDPNLISSGSYDDKLRIWDKRHLKTQLSELKFGGGVWRTKWHPENKDLLLVAAMSDGFHIVHKEANNSLHIDQSYQEHKSLAYGVDWSYHTPTMIGSCSFYDCNFHLWR